MRDPIGGERDVDRLGLLAAAVAGRLLDVAPGERGERAWTDGATVFVDPAAGAGEQVRMLCVQAALLAAGSLDPAVVGALAHRPALARRYLAIEAHRALAAVDDVLPPGVRPLVDHDLARRTGSAADSLTLARIRWALDDPPPAFGTIRARRIVASAERAAAAGAGADTGSPAVERDLADIDDDPDGDLGQLPASPVGGGGPVGRLLRSMLRPARGRGGGGPPGADAPTHVTRSRPGAGRPATPATGPTGRLDGPPALAPEGFAYPEWDVHRRRYRPAWCTVVESDPPEPGGAGGRRRRCPTGSRCDARSPASASSSCASGGSPTATTSTSTPRSRRASSRSPGRRPTRRSTSTAFAAGATSPCSLLLDVSGSVGEPGATGRTVHEHQRAAAAALTVALHDLGDRVALYAFRSQGRSAVHVVPVKRFDDDLDAHVMRRLGGLVPGAYTRLGAPIRHGAAVLEERGGTSRRLLVVLSDGFAYDHGYEGRVRRGRRPARARGGPPPRASAACA